MVDPSALHSITASMHEGMLTLAAICIFLRFSLGNRSEKIRRCTEPTALLSSIGGTIGIFLSGVTGAMLRPTGTLLSSPILLNKVMFTAFIGMLWSIFVIVQIKYGNRLWTRRSLSLLTIALVLVGYGGTVFTGSMGGHLVGKESVLDSLYALLNTSPEALWVASPFYSLAEVLRGKPFTLSLTATSMLQVAVIVDIFSVVVLAVYFFGLHEPIIKLFKAHRKQTPQGKSGH